MASALAGPIPLMDSRAALSAVLRFIAAKAEMNRKRTRTIDPKIVFNIYTISFENEFLRSSTHLASLSILMIKKFN
jgi:hypothetical protein